MKQENIQHLFHLGKFNTCREQFVCKLHAHPRNPLRLSLHSCMGSLCCVERKTCNHNFRGKGVGQGLSKE